MGEKIPIREIANYGSYGSYALVELICEENHHLFYPAHRHDFYLLEFITEGEGCQFIDFEKTKIVPNMITMLSPGQVHEMKEITCKGYAVAISKDLFDHIQAVERMSFSQLFYNPKNSYSIIIENENVHDFRELFSLLYNEFSKNHSNKKLIRYYVASILINCLRYFIPPEGEKISNRVVELLEEINNSYLSERSVSYYSNKLSISSKYLNKLTKTYLNKSLSSLIYDRVLLEAKRELCFTDKTIKEIAYFLGFNDAAYFSRFFKKNEGITPEEFRKFIQ